MFAFRTLLVWGREFSFNLLISGASLQYFEARLSPEKLHSQPWLFSIQESPWDWALDQNSHQPLTSVSDSRWKAQIQQRGWVKISISHALADFDAVPQRGAAIWEDLLKTFQ